MVQNSLITFAIINLSILLGYSIYFFSRLTFFKSKALSFNKPISIIICAQNEADNLKKFLPKILEQDYLEFEVVVVNDQSKDGTAAILKN